jgi:pyridoxal 5'-phosphate synthase pdxS subunit
LEGIKQVVNTPQAGLKELAATFRVPVELVKEVKKLGKLPVVNFAAGGVATPADAALMMQLGAEGVFVGSGIFKSSNPSVRARAIVKAVTHYQDAAIIADVSKNLGDAMPGLDIKQIPPEELLAKRGW